MTLRLAKLRWLMRESRSGVRVSAANKKRRDRRSAGAGIR